MGRTNIKNTCLFFQTKRSEVIPGQKQVLYICLYSWEICCLMHPSARRKKWFCWRKNLTENNMRKDKQYKQSLPLQMEVPYEGMISTCQYDLHLIPTNFHLKTITWDPKTKSILLPLLNNFCQQQSLKLRDHFTNSKQILFTYKMTVFVCWIRKEKKIIITLNYASKSACPSMIPINKLFHPLNQSLLSK